jgi:thioredoxin 1
MKKWLALVFMLAALLLSCGGLERASNNLKPEDLKRKYILYVYYADWCGVCKSMSPEIDELETQYKGKVRVGRLNIDHYQKLAREKNIQGVPTMILSDGARDISRYSGYMSYNQLTTWIHNIDKGK